jgi:glycerol uptake facilitator-like aquaporin
VSVYKKLFAELLGTTILLLSVIGSGIMAESLSNGNNAIALIANTLATVFALYALIEVFAPVSGAHFNPVVSFVMYLKKYISLKQLMTFTIFQLFGAMLGAFLANYLFGLDAIEFSTKDRSGTNLFASEIVATFGLVFFILRSPPAKVASIVACYIGSAYWFTSSTSFANPAAAFGRMFTNTFSGISPHDVPLFILAQFVGGYIAYFFNSIFEQR